MKVAWDNKPDPAKMNRAASSVILHAATVPILYIVRRYSQLWHKITMLLVILIP